MKNGIIINGVKYEARFRATFHSRCISCDLPRRTCGGVCCGFEGKDHGARYAYFVKLKDQEK